MRIDFIGYADDCTVAGQIEFDGGRLSDLLARAAELVVHDATLHSLRTGQRIRAGRIVLTSDDLLAVEGRGPSGSEQRRVRTMRHLLRATLGPYVVFGDMHTLPGVEPLRLLLMRRTMVPLTNCAIHFQRAGHDEIARAAVLIVNGALIDRVEAATDQQLENEFAALDLGGSQAQPAPPA
jgi:hypothetical protein